MTSTLLVLAFAVAFACGQPLGANHEQPNETRKTFLYYAYGSNMLSTRIHKNNPSAKSVSIARLKDYHLDFVTYDPAWHGCVSTIEPRKGTETWGVVWELDIADMANLDRQEDVEIGFYIPKTVAVKTPAGEVLECRTYQQTVSPDTYAPPSELPSERQPSPAYLDIAIEGAKEHNIPSHYLDFLRSFRHNGYRGKPNYI